MCDAALENSFSHASATIPKESHPTVFAAPQRKGALSSAVGVAFDLEGTTVDLEAFRHGGHLKAAQELGIELSRERAIAHLEHFIGGPDEKVAEDLHDLCSHTLPRIEFVQEFLRLTRESFEINVLDAAIRPRDGVVDFIDWLREQNSPFAIGSLTEREQAIMIIRRSGLDQVFGEKILVREDVLNLKPAPDIYLKTAEVMGISPRRQIVFEDSPRGVIAAIVAGSHAVAMPVVTQAEALEALKVSGASHIYYSWRDPALKDYAARLIQELGTQSL